MIKTIVLNLVITIALLASYKAYNDKQLERNTNEVVEFLKHYPQIKVFNVERMTTELLNSGHTALEVAEYGDLLVKYMSAKGYLVIDSESVISQPKYMKMQHVTLERLRTEAEAMGIKTTSDYNVLLQAEKEKTDKYFE